MTLAEVTLKECAQTDNPNGFATTAAVTELAGKVAGMETDLGACAKASALTALKGNVTVVENQAKEFVKSPALTALEWKVDGRATIAAVELCATAVDLQRVEDPCHDLDGDGAGGGFEEGQGGGGGEEGGV